MDEPGYVKILAVIEQYFKRQWVFNTLMEKTKPKVRMTPAPPIYFQHSGKHISDSDSIIRQLILLKATLSLSSASRN